MSNEKQRIVIAVLTVLIAIGVVAVVVRMATTVQPRTTVADVVSDPTPSPDLSLEGTWKSEKINGNSFTATIQDDTITVMWNMSENHTGLYWVGDFPSKIIGVNMETTGIMSNADKAKLAKSVAGSQSDTKQFVYEKDKLTFTFSAMGVEKIVELKR